MKIRLYIDGKKITRKALASMIGEDRCKRYIANAKASFRADPEEQIAYWIGYGMLTIEFV